MSDQTDAWTDIPAGPAGGGRTERRADPEHPLDFYRARDEQGRYQLILKAAVLPDLSPLPTLSGLNVRAVTTGSDLIELVLELLDNEQVSIFRALCADILNATRDVARGDASNGARRIVLRIERWQDLLKRRRDHLLSRQSIIGLIGELLFLRDHALAFMAPNEALAAWRGPHREEQDFAIGETIVEIKTQLSTADQYLMISSEAQLDISSGPIVLCHQTLAAGPMAASSTARTLNGLVSEIRTSILERSPPSLDLFEAGLVAAGYETRDEYDGEHWVPVHLRLFEVCGDFPRLVPDNLPVGIQKVSYRIIPASCTSFERDDAWMKEVVFG